MGEVRALFDLIKKAPDFAQLVMDLGDGSPVHVLDTNTGDKFLPGKLALGLSYNIVMPWNTAQMQTVLRAIQTVGW